MTRTGDEIVTLSENGAVATIRIGTGERFNALGIDGWRELEAVALCCDLQLVNSTARLGMPFARLGILAPASFANRLSLRVGPSRAKAVLFDIQLLTAQRAGRLGLVTTLVADHAIDAALAELLAAWGAVSAASLRAAKAAVDLGLRPVAEPARRAPMGLASDPEEFSRRVSSFLHHTP